MADESGRYTSVGGQRLNPNQYLMWPTNTPKMQPAQQQGPPPANKMLAQMSNRALKGIDQKYAPAFKELQTALEYEVQRINEQFDIKQQDMYRLFTSESDPKRKKAIESQMLTAKNAAQARIADVRSKQRPAVDQINAARQQEIQAMQHKMTQKNTVIQAAEGMVKSGLLSKGAATQWVYRNVLGLPAPDLMPKQATLVQRKATIKRDLDGIRSILKAYEYTPEGVWHKADPHGRIIDQATGKKRAATKEEAEQFKLLKQKEVLALSDYQAIMIESDPRFGPIIERDRLNREASKALTGGARPNLETAIRSTVGKESKTNKPIIQHSKSRGQTRISYDGGRTWQIQ